MQCTQIYCTRSATLTYLYEIEGLAQKKTVVGEPLLHLLQLGLILTFIQLIFPCLHHLEGGRREGGRREEERREEGGKEGGKKGGRREGEGREGGSWEGGRGGEVGEEGR